MDEIVIPKGEKHVTWKTMQSAVMLDALHLALYFLTNLWLGQITLLLSPFYRGENWGLVIFFYKYYIICLC